MKQNYLQNCVLENLDAKKNMKYVRSNRPYYYQKTIFYCLLCVRLRVFVLNEK